MLIIVLVTETFTNYYKVLYVTFMLSSVRVFYVTVLNPLNLNSSGSELDETVANCFTRPVFFFNRVTTS